MTQSILYDRQMVNIAAATMPPDDKRLKAAMKKLSGSEAIHSGHFMVSDIDDPDVHEDEATNLTVHESDGDQEVQASLMAPVSEIQDYNFEAACSETTKTFFKSSHSISIDASLTKLFECMTLAYSGKLTSPKWKSFKGLKLRLKDKIRLNNIIWRAWHIQFISRRRPLVCQFASPVDGDAHNKPEAIVLEGKYWKRKLTNVTAEYQKWRMYFCKERNRNNSDPDDQMMDLEWVQPGSVIDDSFFMDFSDTLFSSLTQPFPFPDPREIATKAGIADFIQPGLVQLQPMCDDIMDTFEPLSEFLSSKLPTLMEEVPYMLDDVHMMPQTSTFPQHTTTASSYKFPQQQQQQLNMQQSTPRSTSYNLHSTSSTARFSPPVTSSDSSFKTPSPAMPLQHQQMSPQPTSSSVTSVIVDSYMTPPAVEQHVSSPEEILPHVPSPQESILPMLSSDQQVPSPVHQNLISSGPNMSQPETMYTPYPQEQRSESRTFTPPGILTPPDGSPSPVKIMHQPSKDVPSQQQQQQFLKQMGMGSPLTSLYEPSNQQLSQVDPGTTLEQQQSRLHESAGVTSQLEQLVQQSSTHLKNPEYFQRYPASVIESAGRTRSGSRRHSYTGLHQDASGNFIGAAHQGYSPVTVSNPVPVASPPINKTVSFAVPTGTPKSRTRSRSASSPQTPQQNVNSSNCGSSGSKGQQPGSPGQTVSLSNVCFSPPLTVSPTPAATPLAPKTCTPTVAHGSPIMTTTNRTGASVQQNTVLTHLLTPGNSFTWDNLNNQASKPAAPTVTIISSVPTPSAVTATQPQTFVISPVSFSIPSSSNFQRGLIVESPPSALTTRSTTAVPVLPPKFSSTGSITSMGKTIPRPKPGEASTPPSAKPFRPKSDEERVQYKEHRRVCHINAEQKRRFNIKNGFESLRQLLPSLNQNPDAKISKAGMLQKGAEYIRILKAERQQQQEEAERLRKQIEGLNQAISMFQSQLPATGVPLPCQRTNHMRESFDDYVRTRTLQNWKFWIFSLLLEPLLESYNNSVSKSSVDEMCKTILLWIEQHCSLTALRPVVLDSLRQLSMNTNILSDPSCLPEEAAQAVTKKESSRQQGT